MYNIYNIRGALLENRFSKDQNKNIKKYRARFIY